MEYILLTHAHFDHILDIDSWVEGTGAKVIISEYEVDALSDSTRNCYKFFNGSDRGYYGKAYGLSDGEKIILGDVDITLLNTPGHTVGSSVYLTDGAAFVGDCVFAGGGYGRTDLPTGDFLALRDSIDKIISLPDDTVLYPGHGQCTTVKEYKQDIGR
jgi:glyoxylase-like metal-dependent hydrolase (beta-lactamase superfamily II)